MGKFFVIERYSKKQGTVGICQYSQLEVMGAQLKWA